MELKILKPYMEHVDVGTYNIQVDKIKDALSERRLLYEGLEEYVDYFILPKAADKSDPSWFGFLLTVKEE